MKCPKCHFVQSDQNTKCSKCGIILEKYQRHPPSPLRKGTAITKAKDNVTEGGTFFQSVILFVGPRVNPFCFGGRVLIILIMLIWGLKLMLTPMSTNDVGNSFLHLVNLPFHEAGHIFFQLFGRWMTSLGGTLGQLLVPILCCLVLLLKSKDPFGASVSLWWFGENFMDIAPYINDARAQNLVLLGGITGKEADYGYHDWEFILTEIGLLRYDHSLARMAHTFGMILMSISLVWAGYLLFKQYKNLDLS
jgi:hypothetical protein